MTRQEALLRRALLERGVEYDSIAIDHANGRSTVDGTSYGIVYPDSFFRNGKALLGAPKKRRAYFRGRLTPQRRAVMEPLGADIEASEFGRDRTKKDAWDPVYFERLASAEFGLCPHHPEWGGPWATLWTYRFIDCVLVGAIPVVFRVTPLCEPFVGGFHYVWDNQLADASYLTEAAVHNHRLAAERFAL